MTIRTEKQERPLYTIKDLAALRDSTLLGSEVVVEDMDCHLKKVVIMGKYPHIILTTGGCYTWVDVLLNKGRGWRTNEKH